MENWKKLVVFAVLASLAIVGWTMLQPAILAYQVKTLARTSCNQMMREVRYNQIGTNNTRWEAEFVRKVRAEAKVALEKDWYAFEVEGRDNPAGDLFCNATITFPTKTPWVGISEVVELKPYVVTKTVKIVRQRAAAGF